MDIITHQQANCPFAWSPSLDGTDLAAGTVTALGQAYACGTLDLSTMAEGDRLYLEPTGPRIVAPDEDGDYAYTPLAGVPQTSPGPLAWLRGGQLHVLVGS